MATTPDATDTAHDHDHDRGLAFDLQALMHRRRVLLGLGAAGLATLVGCSSSGDDAARTTTTTAAAGSSSTTAAGGAAASTAIPEETSGPFPGDGSNGPDALGTDGVVRKDLTTSFGGASGVAEGVPLTIELLLKDASTGAAKKGLAIYAWHCDREGRYSMYSSGAENENYLRGVQPSDDSGTVTFTSIFPGDYAGRWPHVHFEVYESVDAATNGGAPLHTSQLALPKEACEAVYATTGYEASVANLAAESLETDMVFADSYQRQLATMTGDASSGYTASLTVPV